MDEPTDEPTGTTAELVQDSGSEVFYLALIGAIAGMIAGGVFGLITDNSGLKQIDNPIIFMSAVAVAAVVLGMLASEAWGAVIGAVTRSGAATHEDSMSLVAVIGSAAAAMLLILVAQPLAGPIALLSIVLATGLTLVVIGPLLLRWVWDIVK